MNLTQFGIVMEIAGFLLFSYGLLREWTLGPQGRAALMISSRKARDAAEIEKVRSDFEKEFRLRGLPEGVGLAAVVTGLVLQFVGAF